MATLIGAGGHAEDIAATGTWARRVPHHRTLGEIHGTVSIIIGINDPRLRAQVAGELGVEDESWVHPLAFIGPQCSWGYGTHINYAVSMTRTHIGRHCTISPGVTICGDVTIGDEVLVGAGAVICDRVTIGSRAIIGAGAVVLPEADIYPGTTAIGVPARVYTGNHSPATVGY